jgi:hypothetical protein
MKKNNLNLNIASVQTALKEHRYSLGKETSPFHYINEIRLIYFAVVGNFNPPCDLKSLPRGKMHVARRVICLNRRLIKLHVSFEDRKQACRDLVLRYEAKSLN